MPSMLQPRVDGGAVVVNGALYALGGSYKGRYSIGVSVEMLCFETDEWTMLEPMSRARSHFGSTQMPSCLYVCGGQYTYSTGALCRSVECYEATLHQ